MQKNLEDRPRLGLVLTNRKSSSEDEDTGELKGAVWPAHRNYYQASKKERVIEKKKEKKVIEEVKKDKKGLVSSLRLTPSRRAPTRQKLRGDGCSRLEGHGPRDLKQAPALAKAQRSSASCELQCCMHLIAPFDSNRTIDDYMDVPTWRPAGQPPRPVRSSKRTGDAGTLTTTSSRTSRWPRCC